MNLYVRKGMPLFIWTSILKHRLACASPCRQKHCPTICSNMFCLLLSLRCWPCLFFLEPKLRSCISSAQLPEALLTIHLLTPQSADPVFNYCICCSSDCFSPCHLPERVHTLQTQPVAPIHLYQQTNKELVPNLTLVLPVHPIRVPRPSGSPANSVPSARSQKDLNKLKGEQRWELKLLEA